MWAFGFQFDVTDDGRAVKLLYVVDEFTREALAMEAERRIDADHVVDVLDRLVRERGTYPQFVRCDNGPEMTSAALRDWCRFSRAGAAFIEPGSPWPQPVPADRRFAATLAFAPLLRDAQPFLAPQPLGPLAVDRLALLEPMLMGLAIAPARPPAREGPQFRLQGSGSSWAISGSRRCVDRG